MKIKIYRGTKEFSISCFAKHLKNQKVGTVTFKKPFAKAKSKSYFKLKF